MPLNFLSFVAAWDGVTAERRFAAFVDWVTDDIAGYPQWVSPNFQLINGPSGGNCEPGYQLSRSTFEEPTPANAVSVGHFIIAQCSNLAQDRWIKAYEEQEKKRQKQIAKWLLEMKKEQLKALEDAMKVMLDYYSKKYEVDKGS